MYLLFAQLISSCLAVPDQNVSIGRESCKAGGSSFVPAAVGASYGDVETRITHHQCKSIKGYPYSNKFFHPFQWTNQNWTEFYERCKQAIESFDVLVARVHDIYSNRILHVLMWMQDVSLQILPAGSSL